MKHFRLDKKGIKFIELWEGLKLEAYQCSAYVWTIGIGSTRYQDGTPVKKGDKISKEEAYALFAETVKQYEKAVHESVKVSLTQDQFNALVSFTYNCGIIAFKSSTLLKRLNAGLFEEVEKQFLRWNKAGTKEIICLTNRRKAEVALFKGEWHG